MKKGETFFAPVCLALSIHSFLSHLLSTYCMPGGAEATAVSKVLTLIQLTRRWRTPRRKKQGNKKEYNTIKRNKSGPEGQEKGLGWRCI